MFPKPLAAPGFWFGGNQGVTDRKAPTQGVRGTLVKFRFLKRFKVLENESIFQKENILSCQIIHFFKEKFQNRTYFTRISEFF